MEVQLRPMSAEEFAKERARRVAANRQNLKLMADFTREDGANGWRWERSGKIGRAHV